MTGLERWWRIFWASALALLVTAYPAMADVLNLSLNDTLSCTGGTGGTGQTLFSNYGTGGPDAQLYGCQDASMGFLTSFICLIEATLGMVIAAFFCQLSTAWTAPIGGLILVFMFVSGIAFITGIMQMTVRDFAKIMFKIGLIATFALNTDIALQIAFKLFLGIINETVTMFRDSLGHGVGFASRDNSVSPTDVVNTADATAVSTGEQMGCGFSLINMYALFAIFLMMIAFLPIVLGLLLMAALSVLGFLARAAFGYLYALVMITFLVAAMPIFVSFALFSTTRQIFTAWLAYIFSNIVQIMIVFAFLGFASQVDFLAFLNGLSRLLVTETYTPAIGLGFINLDYCTICEPNIIMVDDIPEIADAPNQCKVIGGKINKISVSEFPMMTDLIYMMMVKCAALYLIGSTLSDFMKDVPQMSKLLGGSSPMMMISGTPRGGGADNHNSIRAPFLTNATVNAEAGFKQAFGGAGVRARVGHGGILTSVMFRSKWGNLGTAIKQSGNSVLHGRSMLDRTMIQGLERNQKALIADATKKYDILKTKADSLSKKKDALEEQAKLLKQKNESLKMAFADKQRTYKETVEKTMETLGSKEERATLERQYGALETLESKAVKKSYYAFSDADKIEKVNLTHMQKIESTLQIMESIKPGEVLDAAKAKEIHQALAGLSSTGMDVSAKLLAAGNTTALKSNDDFIMLSKRMSDMALNFSGKKAISANETELMKKSLQNLKLAHAETAIQLRRHFEATQEKYIGATMERDRHKAEWFFEKMAEKGDVDSSKMAELDDELIRARNEVMIAKKQMDVHKYDLQKNETEISSTTTAFTQQELAFKEAEARKAAIEKETRKGLYLQGKTEESRRFLQHHYGIDNPESGGGMLDEILNPDNEYDRFFGSKRLERYSGKGRYGWLSMMHKAD